MLTQRRYELCRQSVILCFTSFLHQYLRAHAAVVVCIHALQCLKWCLTLNWTHASNMLLVMYVSRRFPAFVASMPCHATLLLLHSRLFSCCCICSCVCFGTSVLGLRTYLLLIWAVRPMVFRCSPSPVVRVTRGLWLHCWLLARVLMQRRYVQHMQL